MPLGKNIRYRWVDPGKPGGKKVRLAFSGKKKVVEAKSSSGKVHTPAEFKKDRAEELRRKARGRHGR